MKTFTYIHNFSEHAQCHICQQWGLTMSLLILGAFFKKRYCQKSELKCFLLYSNLLPTSSFILKIEAKPGLHIEAQNGA